MCVLYVLYMQMQMYMYDRTKDLNNSELGLALGAREDIYSLIYFLKNIN